MFNISYSILLIFSKSGSKKVKYIFDLNAVFDIYFKTLKKIKF